MLLVRYPESSAYLPFRVPPSTCGVEYLVYWDILDIGAWGINGLLKIPGISRYLYFRPGINTGYFKAR